ncbi:MAG TPA: dual specificity protein phosphatase family protein [Pyrinomonadaceae bacterium]
MKPDVYWIEGPWRGKLAILARPRGEDWLEDEIEGWKEADIGLVVSLLTSAEESELGLTSEAEIVKRTGITYITFPIADYSVPASKIPMQQLAAQLNDQLSRGTCIGVHCRQGIGRSSLVAACVLVTSGESPQSAFEHIERARGRSVPDTAEQKRWVISFARDLVTD